MFILLFNLFLIVTKSDFVTLFQIDTTLSNAQVEINQKAAESKQKSCNQNPDEDDCTIYRFYSQILISNGKEMEYDLNKISNSATFLTIVGNPMSNELNLLSIPKKMPVAIYPTLPSDDTLKSTKVDIYAQLASLNTLKKKDEENDIIKIYGYIKRKVTFLIIAHFRVSVSTLEAPNIYFYDSSIYRSDSVIKADYVYFTGVTLPYEQFEAKHFIYVLNYIGDEDAQINYVSNGFEGFYSDSKKELCFVPLSATMDIGIVLVNHNLNINKASETISDIRDINISLLLTIDSHYPIPPKEKIENWQFKVTATGWENSPKKPKITINKGENGINVDTSSLTGFQVTLHQLHSFEEVESGIQNMDSYSRIYEFNDNGFISIENGLFGTETELSYALTEHKTITFHSKEIILKEYVSKRLPHANVYFIAAQKDSKVMFDDDDFLYRIGFYSQNSPTIELSAMFNCISILNKGDENSGSINIEVRDDKNTPYIYLQDFDNVKGDFIIYTSPIVVEICFDNIYFHQKASFFIYPTLNSKSLTTKELDYVHITAYNMSIDGGSEVTIHSLTMLSILSIYDNSTLYLNNNFKLDYGNIHLHLTHQQVYTYDEDYPIIRVSGELNSLPDSVILDHVENYSYFEIKNLPLIAANSFTDCELWKEHIKAYGLMEISTICKEKNGYHLLLVDFIHGEPPKKGLKPGIIAAIVIGSVAVVGVIIGVVVCVVKRKKDKSSEEVA